MSESNFLSRWSRLKKEQASAPAVEQSPAAKAPPAPQQETRAEAQGVGAAPAQPAPPVELPAVESLTPESDFTGFMKPDVDASLRRRALKTLFQDPRFNVMDGLDTYIADYSQPDPLPDGWLEKMAQTARLGEFLEAPVEAQEQDSAGAPPAAADPAPGADKSPQNEALARPAESRVSDTPEVSAVASELRESPPAT